MINRGGATPATVFDLCRGLILCVQTLKTDHMETNHYMQIQMALAEFGKRLQRIEAKLAESFPAKTDWLDHREICRMLGISKRTLDSYRERGLLPYSKIGGKVFYRAADVEDYLDSHITRKEERR